MKRTFIMVLDSLGISVTEDADRSGDVDLDTMGHIVEACAKDEADNDRKGPLNLLNLTRLGLAKTHEGSTGKIAADVDDNAGVVGAYAWAHELSFREGTPSGHWEITGVSALSDWSYFSDHENSLPQELLDKLVKRANLSGYLGNCHSSGTVILDQLGEEHMKASKSIPYVSVDSVFQIACHEEMFGSDRLYELCEIACEELTGGGYNIGHVIVRPFIDDEADNSQHTGNRHDLAVGPPTSTMLQKLIDEKDSHVVFVGEIVGIYVNCGITKKVKAIGLDALSDTTIKEMKEADDKIIIFTNFVNFGSPWGHHHNIAGYATGLELFGRCLLELMELASKNDIPILTADHGCDPNWTSTDHTREHIPTLVYSPKVKPGFLSHHETFTDIGQTLTSYFDIPPMNYDRNML